MRTLGQHRTFRKMNGLKVNRMSFARYLCGKIRLFLCQFGIHKGKVFRQGYITVTNKKNKPETFSRTPWNIRRCDYCFEIFAKPEDCIKSKVT